MRVDATEMQPRDGALYYFRHLVYCLYREIGVLRSSNHAEVAKKAWLKSGFFTGDRKRQAGDLYCMTRLENRSEAILRPYKTRTGLTLEDIFRAFDEGNWQQGGHFVFGGPKWAKIAENTMALRDAIDSENWTTAKNLILEIRTLEHNNALVVTKFKDADNHCCRTRS